MTFKPTTLKELSNIVLLTYGIFGGLITITGGFLHSIFFVLLGLIVAVIGMIFVEKIRSSHIISLLKKNNLWDGKIIDPQTKEIEILKERIKVLESKNV